MSKIRIGIVGFGHLGQFLYNNLIQNDKLEVVFIWNRSKAVFSKTDVPAAMILEDLENFAEREADLIVEVAHPCISQQFGKLFLEKAHYFVGSPTALADKETYDFLSKAAETFEHKVLIPNGALWGGEDIRRMALQGSLKGLTITMSKHPSSFKLSGTDKSKLDSLTEPMTVYEGSVRELCPLAPNNVNTMAAAAVAALNLGFDGVKGRIIADPSLKNWHVIEVEAIGPAQSDGRTFSVKTVRRNPADPGAVTGTATFNSFMASLVNAASRISDGTYGFQLC